ncbi:serine/threonine protein kinase [Steroidobacter denitrificans]|uniref:Serine/threonine protein kinase n=1 Tax=Steroidobacter denitrificans TaxID=465721 RepID=A0A127F7S0_STEDE|nr:serine/threonine-protein kinase [Steroidobacter denitrificans]AMN45671.1 serine/threonine protein kinase [Steroidobacter denitrificans]
MTLESGDTLSERFVLIRQLGTGGSGEVWLARDYERDSFVAVKILAVKQGGNAAALWLLHREYGLLRRLAHEHIVRVDGLYRSGGHAWIAMEYLDGGDLSQLRGCGWGEILRVVLPVAAALAHVHDAGIVHRDVKPANVMLTTTGAPRLVDFGTALALTAVPAPDAGRGSPFTMSQQQRTGAPASIADDIYGYGALLYELLCGYPPFYPDEPVAYDLEAGRVAGGSARQPAARTAACLVERPVVLPASGRSMAALDASVPLLLARLLERMLAPLPEQRPSSMHVIERELKTVLANSAAPVMIDNVNSSTPRKIILPVTPPASCASAGQEPLRGEWRRPSAAPVGMAAGEHARRILRAGLVAAGVLAAVVVFIVLPRWVAERQMPAPPAAAPEPLDTPAREPVDLTVLAHARQGADEQRIGLQQRLDALRERAASQWDEAAYTRAAGELAAGDEAYAEREYIAATEHYRTLESLVDVLEQRADEVLVQRLQEGATALQQGAAGSAAAAFELALKIEPDNTEALQGRKRASTLGEVMRLASEAEHLEKDEQTNEALARFREALALDAQAQRAGDGVRRIEARLAGDAFAAAMARGYSALAAGDYPAANGAFEAARRIRPAATEIAPALHQVEQERRTHEIATKLELARQLEMQEQWARALTQYRTVLELDTTIAAAAEGLARATPRATLNEQLELYLTQPERLFSQSVRISAKEMMARARAIESPGPVLSKQLATLQQWLERADVPVVVALQSDNITQVTIYRVGEFGAFTHRSLELLPGSYTVVGTRAGYRDVRREITVRPGTVLEPIVIQCEDRI